MCTKWHLNSNISIIVLLARVHYAHAHNSTFIRLEHVPDLLMFADRTISVSGWQTLFSVAVNASFFSLLVKCTSKSDVATVTYFQLPF